MSRFLKSSKPDLAAQTVNDTAAVNRRRKQQRGCRHNRQNKKTALTRPSDNLSPVEQKWAAAFRRRKPEWTPDCIDPEVMVELAAKKNKHPDFNTLMLHLSGCRYCMEAYRDITFCLREKRRHERKHSAQGGQQRRDLSKAKQS